MTNKTQKQLIPPLMYAFGSFAVIPVVALLMFIAGILLLLGWPFIPILSYFQRKEEISKERLGFL